jgi:hypothetical protein
MDVCLVAVDSCSEPKTKAQAFTNTVPVPVAAVLILAKRAKLTVFRYEHIT